MDNAVSTITRTGAVAVFVAYNIPGRDCGQYSAGGANGGDAYRKWIRAFAGGLRGREAIVILEPDALAGMDCLNAGGQTDRVALLADAVKVLESQSAAVYIDAGHARWHPPEKIAARLRQADIASADGFSLNVSNYIDNAANIAFGERSRGSSAASTSSSTPAPQRTRQRHRLVQPARPGAGRRPHDEHRTSARGCLPLDQAAGRVGWDVQGRPEGRRVVDGDRWS